MGEAAERVEVFFACDASSVHWSVLSGQLDEHLDEPYRLVLSLATNDRDAEPVTMLGKPASVTLIRADRSRTIKGVVSEIEEGMSHLELIMASVVLVPALEALRHRVNTRIFQDCTVPEILEAVLSEGLAGYDRSLENRLTRPYPTCEFRVQYDESDLAFCQRLMEEEGIVYFFEHEAETETLVLADSKQAYHEIHSDHALVQYSMRREDGVEGTEYVNHLEVTSRLAPTKVVTRHFDWTAPSVPIEADSTESDPGAPYDFPSGAHLEPEREVYQHDDHPLTHHEYGGGAYQADDASEQVRLRREAQMWEARVARGESTVMGIIPGAIFELSGHPRADLDGRYLAISVTHRFGGDAGRTYRNDFRCIPEGVPYRPRRRTRKPRVSSVQTATVVGPAGEEIHTDEHGRIKVQLHWDRLGKSDEHSSCWTRVTQPWAGAGWGFVFIPRIGMEVVVDFVTGDPDQPVIIGAVYNSDHQPPYALPNEKTKSTIKTESSLGGGGFNELRFEDKAGSEEIYTHAQKDQNEVVENDHTTTVHHDQQIRVDNDQTQEVGNDQTEHVFANQSLEVDANRTVQVHGNFEETVDGTETRQVTGDVSETFSANETRAVSGNMDETISGSRTQTISGSSTETISGSLTQTVAGAVTISTPATYDITATSGFSMTTPSSSTISAQGGYSIVSSQTTLHDVTLTRIGQMLADFYSDYMSVCVFKVELVLNIAATAYGALAFELRGFHAEIFPILMKTFILKIENRGTEATTEGSDTTAQAVSVGPPD